MVNIVYFWNIGTQDRRQREKEALRRNILDTATELVSQYGHEQLTIRALAHQIEYSPRTIYLHFQDKDALLRAIVESGFQRTLEYRAQNPRQRQQPVETRIRRGLHTHISTALANPNMYRAIATLLLEKNYSPGPAQREIIAQTTADIRELAHRADNGTNGDRAIDDNTIDTAAMLLFSTLRGFTLSLINEADSTEPHQQTERIRGFVEFAVHGICNVLETNA